MRAGVILDLGSGVAADGTLFTLICMSFRQLIERLLLLVTETRWTEKRVALILGSCDRAS